MTGTLAREYVSLEHDGLQNPLVVYSLYSSADSISSRMNLANLRLVAAADGRWAVFAWTRLTITLLTSSTILSWPSMSWKS